MPFIELQSVDSTNNYAREQIHAGLAQHGMAIFAHRQLAGKGQRGKIWLTENAGNIALSIIVKTQAIPLTAQFQLSAVAAVAAQLFFSQYASEDTKIKWPNDLYWQDRKAGGILIESVIRSSESGTSLWEWAIIGIGININQTSFSPELPNPVSMKQITGKTFDPVLLAKQLHSIFLQQFDELVTRGFSAIYEQYLANLYKKNERVRLRKDNRAFEAIIMGVSESGRLIAEHGLVEEYEFGAIEWLLK
jgi:BirA family biotin operon repressor/biotin-[acetyl-CoA-carboxylase] ligase